MPSTLHSTRYRRFLELLREEREAQELAQKDLARLLGWDQSKVSKSETGVRRLDVVELIDWCRALGIDFDEFCDRLNREIPSRRSRRR